MSAVPPGAGGPERAAGCSSTSTTSFGHHQSFPAVLVGRAYPEVSPEPADLPSSRTLWGTASPLSAVCYPPRPAYPISSSNLMNRRPYST